MSLSTFKFRVATVADVAAIVELVNLVFRRETGLRSWTGEAHLIGGQRVDAEQVKEMIEAPRSRVILACRDQQPNQVRGCVVIKEKGRECFLSMLTVHIDEQKSGLGSQLVIEAERQANADYGSSVMAMHVISIRKELIAWYERRGYSITDEKTPFPYGNERYGIPKRNDLEFLILKKSLVNA